MMRLKNLAIRGSKKDRLLLVDSFVSEKFEFHIPVVKGTFNNDF
jgi:hypothetical protein